MIEPEVPRRKITVPRIKSSNIELGLDYGALSIEDFGTNPVYGVTAAYHVTEDFFFQAEAGRSRGGRTSFETLSGNIQLLTESERRFTYYDLSLGYNFLPGEAFVGRGLAMTSAFYLLGGFGSTDFAGDTKFTVNFGAGYRVVPVDWLAFHVTVQDHVFQTSLLGVTKLTNNLEARPSVRPSSSSHEGPTMRNRIAAMVAVAALAVPALAADPTGSAGPAVHARRPRRQGK